MSFNYVRILIQCLKETFGLQHVIYLKVLLFIKKFNIKSQVWAF